MAERQLPSTEAIEHAFSTAGDTLEVAAVASVWAPMVEYDEAFAKSTAERLLSIIEEGLDEPLDDEVKVTLLKFGVATGSLALRRLFQPFQSDEIWVDYRENSELDQTDAVRRVERGIGHPAPSKVME